MLSIISLRNPISRIVSMYWYEHVGWFDGVLKQTNKCKPLRQWIDTWKDGSDFKRDFVRKNPKNVYVEISNYYTKILIGWDGNSKSELTEEDYLLAKKNLLKFDLVFITEWMSDSTQVDALNSLFPGRQTVAPGHKIRGDNKAKERLKDKLASDEVSLHVNLLFNISFSKF